MPKISCAELTAYLSEVLGKKVKLVSFASLGKKPDEEDLKGYSYGKPMLIEYKAGGELKKAVLSSMLPTPFGHDFFYDRAASLLFSHQAFNRLPRHVRSLDVGAMTARGELLSLGKAQEFFMLDIFVEGSEYFKDLERLEGEKQASVLDLKRARALSDYLVVIHRSKKAVPNLYVRRIRDLLGHGECIMGLIDNYPEKFEFINEKLLHSIEQKCLEWRWKLKKKAHRLCVVHGDFHPWNILFKKGPSFAVLDRSRGEWGEAADDVSCMGINYLFFSLQKHLKFREPFTSLYREFVGNYLEKTGDRELSQVIQPFFAWRGLVVASPVWYPHLPPGVRRKLFNFIENVLSEPNLDLLSIEKYLEG